MLRRFEARGHVCHYVDYRPSREPFESIRRRLGDRLVAVAASGPYVLIGYSFGGVLARSALTALSAPSPLRLVLVASPMHSLRMCRAVGTLAVFRWLTGECGQLLASESGMQGIPTPDLPTTCIYGTKRHAGPLVLLGREPSDGMVTVSEIDPHRFADVLAVPAGHPSIVTSHAVIKAIEARIDLSCA